MQRLDAALLRARDLFRRLDAVTASRFRDAQGRLVLSLPRLLYGTAAALVVAGLVGTVGAALALFPAALWIVGTSLLTATLLLVQAGRSGVAWSGDRSEFLAVFVALLAALSAGTLRHEYTQGQMDIGLYTNDAFAISMTGGRVLDHPHDALLPGYVAVPNGAARPSAMFGYSALAAFAATIFGYWGVGWVNAPLAFATGLAVFHVGRRVASGPAALGGLVAYEASFLTLWFQRWTMTENAATFVFFVVAALVLDLHGRAPGRGRLLLLSATLLFGALARPEGLLLALPVAALLAPRLLRRSRAGPGAARRTRTGALVGIVLLLGVVAAVAHVLPREYLAAGWMDVKSLASGRPAADAPDVPTTGPHPNWGDYALRFEWDSVAAYAVPGFLVAATVGTALGLLDRRRVAILVALCAPYILFVLMPPVTTFHPWFMRRLWIAVIPLALLLGGSSLVHAVRLRLPPGGAAARLPASARVALRFVAATAALVLLLQVLDVDQPFLARNESDGSHAATRWLQGHVPPGSCLLADQDVVGYGIPIRYVGDVDVVPFFNDLPSSLLHAAAAVRAPGDCRLLRLNTTLPTNPLRLAPDESSRSIEDFSLEIRVPPRSNLRAYISQPPLAQGYAPLAEQLASEVPPRALLQIRVRLQLVAVPLASPLEKGASFDPATWTQEPDGMRAASSGGRLEVPWDAFSDDGLHRTGLTLAFVTPADARGNVSYAGTTYAFEPLRATVFQGFALHLLALAAPVQRDAPVFGAGSTLSAVYMG